MTNTFSNSTELTGIGYRIKELRQQRGLTQAELAQSIGCAQNTIAGWEGDAHRSPNKKFISKLAGVLDVPIDYLLRIDKTEKPRIPYYGGVYTTSFTWSDETRDYFEITPGEYSNGQFILKIFKCS